MEKQQFEKLVLLLEKEIEYLQVMTSQLGRINESIQLVFLR